MKGMFVRASEYIASFGWCERIVDTYVGDVAIGGVVAVLLFKIEPRGFADDLVWVVVGDLPSAYIAVEGNPNPACALQGYVRELERWADAAEAGRSTGDLMPLEDWTSDVPLEPNTSTASDLRSRIDGLGEIVLAYHRDDLAACGGS